MRFLRRSYSRFIRGSGNFLLQNVQSKKEMVKKKIKDEGQDRRLQIASAFGEIEQSKIFLDKRTESAAVKMDIADLLKDIIQKQLRKDYDPEVESNIFINPERGDFEVYILKKIVDEVDIESIEISLKEVRKIDDSLEIGDYYEEGPIRLEDYLTRKSIQIIKQSVQKKVRDLERLVVYEECLEKVGEIVAGEVYQIRANEVIFTYNTSKDHRVELVLPKSEMMKKDNPRRTPRMKLYVKRIEREKAKVRLDDGSMVEREKADGGMKVIVSRVDDRFLYKLFEHEVKFWMVLLSSRPLLECLVNGPRLPSNQPVRGLILLVLLSDTGANESRVLSKS